MRTKIIPIGNSRGIRIPKALLEGMNLDAEVDIKLGRDGLKITPIVGRKSGTSETALLSQKALAQDWARPEEDTAWQALTSDVMPTDSESSSE